MTNNLLSTLETQRVLICVLQNRDDLKQISVICEKKSRLTSRMQMRYERDHHIKRAVFSIKEGELVNISVRGNITNIPNKDFTTRFYAIHGITLNWKIDVVDVYSQRSLTSFCGFVQIQAFTDDVPASGSGSPSDCDRSWKPLLDVPLTLPKYKAFISPSLTRVPLHLRNEGKIHLHYL